MDSDAQASRIAALERTTRRLTVVSGIAVALALAGGILHLRSRALERITLAADGMSMELTARGLTVRDHDHPDREIWLGLGHDEHSGGHLTLGNQVSLVTTIGMNDGARLSLGQPGLQGSATLQASRAHQTAQLTLNAEPEIRISLHAAQQARIEATRAKSTLVLTSEELHVLGTKTAALSGDRLAVGAAVLSADDLGRLASRVRDSVDP